MSSNSNKKLILKRFNYGFAFITFSWLVIGAVYLYDTFQDRKKVFIPHDIMDLYQTPELNYNQKIGIIRPSDHLKVLKVIFINDHFVVQIQNSNRQIGWVQKPDDFNFK
jgi:hypothetical protein